MTDVIFFVLMVFGVSGCLYGAYRGNKDPYSNWGEALPAFLSLSCFPLVNTLIALIVLCIVIAQALQEYAAS